MGRQVGSVLGVAALIAVLAGVHTGDPITTYRHAIELITAFFLAAALVAAALLGRRSTPPQPSESSTEAESPVVDVRVAEPSRA
jgi:hypothetical protein